MKDKEEPLTPEEIDSLRAFKRGLFDLYWDKFGVFYMHVMPHPKLEIGKRGLTAAEKENGIVLVFGDKAVRDLDNKKDYLFAELQFGARWEPTIVPWDAVSRIFDKFQNSLTQLKFLMSEEPFRHEECRPPSPTKTVEEHGKVIRIDFGGKSQK